MINIASKAGTYMRATSQAVANGLKPLVAGTTNKQNVVVEKSEKLTVDSLIKALPQCGNIGVRSGIPGETDNIRFSGFQRYIEQRKMTIGKTKNYIIAFDVIFCWNFFLILVTTQVRLAHTDIKVPDFSDYRRDSTKRAGTKSKTADDRRSFTYLLVGG